MDNRLRELERESAAGNPLATEQLWQNKKRLGETTVVQCPKCKGNLRTPAPTPSNGFAIGYSVYGGVSTPQYEPCTTCNTTGYVRMFLEDIPIYRPK